VKGGAQCQMPVHGTSSEQREHGIGSCFDRLEGSDIIIVCNESYIQHVMHAILVVSAPQKYRSDRYCDRFTVDLASVLVTGD